MFSTTLKRAVACSTIASLAFIQSKNSYCEMPHAHHNYPRSVDEEKYVRIDTEIIASEFFKQFARKNAFHETLNGEGMIESLELYAKKDADLDDSAELLCVIKYGDSVNGHPGIVHGGILALTFDNCFGWVFFADRQSAGFTANLNINYRSPVMANSTILLTARRTHTEGRKKFLHATMVDTSNGTLLADATALFVSPRTA